MFGSKDKGNNEVAEIKIGPLNLFYVDRITDKRKKTNKISGEDSTVAVITDASEEEFKQIFNNFIAENGDYDRLRFSLSVIENGFYCIVINQQLKVPGQTW